MGRSRQTQTTTQSVPQFYEDFLRQEVFPTATQIGSMPFEAYTGQRVAGVSPLSMGAQGQFDRIAQIGAMTPQDYAAMTQANMNPFQSQVIDASLARAAREREIARTGEMANITQARAFGNDRRGIFEAERQAQFDLGQQEMIANLMQQGYGQAQAQTMAQLQMGQGAAGQAAAGMMQLGGLQQVTDQAALDAAYEEFIRRQNFPLQQLGALVSASSGAQIPMSSTTTQSGSSGLSGVLGAIGGIGQAIAAFPSDRRLKRNVRRVGERQGVTFYAWEWRPEAADIARGAPSQGVIADELELVHPDLVSVGAHGFKMVNYAGLAERLG